jgi:hypothetical protein
VARGSALRALSYFEQTVFSASCGKAPLGQSVDSGCAMGEYSEITKCMG